MDQVQKAMRRIRREARRDDPNRDVKLLATAAFTFIGGLTTGAVMFVVGTHLSWQFRLATSLIVSGVGGGLLLAAAGTRENYLREERGVGKGETT